MAGIPSCRIDHGFSSRCRNAWHGIELTLLSDDVYNIVLILDSARIKSGFNAPTTITARNCPLPVLSFLLICASISQSDFAC
jgi:hypothetical protein